MKHRLLIFSLLLLLVSAVALPSATAAKPPLKGKNPFADIPITGTVAGGGVVTGLFTIDHFQAQGGQLLAVGTFTGAVGGLKAKDVPLTLPATLTAGQAAADTGGRAGLPESLAGCRPARPRPARPGRPPRPGHLNITAESGPGNLLGNLLCAVAGLLDGIDLTIPGNLAEVVALLNAIIALFG